MLVRDLMGQFSKLREKEESLGEVLKLRIHDKKEFTSTIEKIRDICSNTLDVDVVRLRGRRRSANR